MSQATTYTVQPGDSLSAISKKFYGDFSMADSLAAANGIANKNLIMPGQQLTIPAIEDAEVVESNVVGSSSKKKYLWLLLVVGVAGYFGYRQYKKRKSTKKSLSGNANNDLKESDVEVGDYVLLDTGNEVAKIKITSIKDKYERTEITGDVTVKGKKKSVAVLKSDFEKGFVKKIGKATKVKQRLTGSVKSKSKACSMVLQLMDKDYSYTDALNKVLSENKSLKKKELEKELDNYI